MKKQDAAGKKPEKRDWLAEILLNATSERRRINSIKLPDEPDFQDRPSRVDDGQFQSSVGSLMSEMGDKIERAEKEKQAEIKEQGVEPVDETAAIRGSNSVHTWSSWADRRRFAVICAMGGGGLLTTGGERHGELRGVRYRWDGHQMCGDRRRRMLSGKGEAGQSGPHRRGRGDDRFARPPFA